MAPLFKIGYSGQEILKDGNRDFVKRLRMANDEGKAQLLETELLMVQEEKHK